MSIKTYQELIGKTFKKVYVSEDKDRMHFDGEDKSYMFYHIQDCCESVQINDIVGDLSTLEGSPILMAEESTTEGREENGDRDHFRWTFYKFATIKGYVTVRWLGTSNGWYSESVDFGESNAHL